MEASDWMKYNPLTAVVEQSAPPKGAPLPHLLEFPRAPRPDAARVFTQNGVRIQALNDRLIRIEYSRDRVFEDRASFTFPIRDVSDSDSLGPLTSEYDESSGVLSVATPLVKVEVATQKESFDPAMVTATALTGDKAVHPFLSDDAPTSGKFLLEGTCRTLDEA